MTETNKNGKSQVAFSLATKKKKKTTRHALQDFAVDESVTVHKRPERTTPLVIPLTQPTAGPLAKLKQDDAAAAQALMDSAALHFSQQQSHEGTNFSATGTLSIASKNNAFEQQQHYESNKDAEQLQRDLQSRADDITVESDVYKKIPIGEFGAALLRGMGWKGDDSNKKDTRDDMSMPRPHRLGLGATPKLPDATPSGKLRRPDQVKRDERLQQQHQEYEAKRQEQVRLDKQQTMQTGSIVRITDTGIRARMVQMMGIPGLNRVLVQYEGEADNTAVKKGHVVLVSRQELEERPFREIPREKETSSRVKKEGDNVDYDRERRDRKRIKREDDDTERDRDGDKRQKRNVRDHHIYHSSHRQSDKKRQRSDSDDEQHWLIPNIRVRVVTKKVSSRQYKQKGLVLDVTHGGACATLQMSDGQILDRVPERYLETAFPKVGGNAIVLTGKHRLQKGKLLERNSERGKGVIQVFEDMNVVNLSLDDMAEWCGPLDDDMER